MAGQEGTIFRKVLGWSLLLLALMCRRGLPPGHPGAQLDGARVAEPDRLVTRPAGRLGCRERRCEVTSPGLGAVPLPGEQVVGLVDEEALRRRHQRAAVMPQQLAFIRRAPMAARMGLVVVLPRGESSVMQRDVRSRDAGARRSDVPADGPGHRAAQARAPTTGGAAHPPAILGLQRTAGNRAVSHALRNGLFVQRADIVVFGGGHVTSVNGPGTNELKPVMLVQERLMALGVLAKADADADRARMKAQTGRIMNSDIPKTLEALDNIDAPSLSEPVAKKVLKADLVAGVGEGQTNDADDVELVLNLLHEEWHISNADFDASTVALAGTDRTVDPSALPGFLPGLTKLKRGFAGGFPFRGTIKRRKGLVTTAGTAAYQKAVAYNAAGRALMQKWMEDAADQHADVVLKNSAEWCLSGKTKMFCQTKTHDSAARVSAEHKPARFEAVFGYPLGALSEAQVPYLRKRRGDAAFDNTNVAIQAPEGGAAGDKEIMVNDPANSGKAYFLDTIRHEVQHAADKHLDTDEGLYKTEINARWVENRFARYSTTRRVTRLGHTWNERQYAAFMNLWSYPDLYPYLRKNWNAPVRAERDAWRAMVVGYTKPDSFNPINSIRIDALNDALWEITNADCDADDKFRAHTGPENAKATAVKKAMGDLDALDRTTIKSNTVLQARANVHLTGKLLADWAAFR